MLFYAESRIDAHPHDIGQLLPPVPNTKLAFLDALRDILMSLRVRHRDTLHMLDETLHVAHPEEFRDERLGGESL